MPSIKAVVVFCVALAIGAGQSAGWTAAPGNAWVKVESDDNGDRGTPMFFYEPGLKKFIVSGGSPGGYYGGSKQHYDTEELDLKAGQWINAYPQGAPIGYAPPSGPTQAPVSQDERNPYKDAGGYLRLPRWASYGNGSRAYFQYAYDTDSRRLFAYLLNQTLSYDPVTRTWSDTGAKPFSQGQETMHWGSLCYDPVNKEIVAVGGTSDEMGGTPGTSVYNVAANSWRKLKLGSEKINRLRAATGATGKQAWALIAACRNRFYVTETAAEAKAKISDRAAKLEKAIAQLATAGAAEKLTGKLTGHEVEQLGLARREIAAAASSLKKSSNTWDTAMSAATIAGAQAVYDTLERAVNALTVEPPARAMSQMAFDAASRRIVLFGGDGLDRHYADTWVYDCKTRTWEQKYPRLSPSPRAGHALVYLPRSKKVLLLGGYGLGNDHSYMYGGVYRSLPFEMWAYDTAANQWRMLPRTSFGEDGQPAPGNFWWWPAAADEDDTVALIGPSGQYGRTTWACRVDPSQADADGTVKFGVSPGTLAFRGDEDTPHAGAHSYDPAFYDRESKPDPVATAATFPTVPVNTWQAIQPPKGVDSASWGTTAFDPDREQFLFWGGGHDVYKGTNVSHYSLRTNLWSTSCRPEWVIEASSDFLLPVRRSFHDRPHIPVHAYRAYAYDPPSGLMLYLDRAYNVSEREWEPDPVPMPFSGGVMHTLLETTPHGVVAWAEQGLLRFDAASHAWQKLPLQGPNPGAPWCDGSALSYDAKRDCLWMAPGKNIFRYDMKSGNCEAVDVPVPARLGGFALWEEQVFLPEADLILLMRRFKGPDGKETNIAFDPDEKKYYAVELPFSDGQEHNFSWSGALHFDAKRKLIWLHNGDSTNFWVLRFDRKTAKITEIKD